MTRTLAVLVLILAGWASAQPVVTRGGALKKRAYQTYSALTFYVAPTGSDSNACTASGAEACLTLNGVFAKLPRFIRHNVTINVAAGTYATAATLQNITLEGATLTIAGTLTNATLATGSVTGSVTSSVAGSAAAGPQSVVDSTQTWTSSDLHGKLFSVTSGAANGQAFPIDTNTGTAVTIPRRTALVVGVTYAVQVPSATFSNLLTFRNVLGPGNVIISRIGFAGAAATAVRTEWGTSANITVRECTVSAPVPVVSVSGLVTISRSFVTSTSASGVALAVVWSSVLPVFSPSIFATSSLVEALAAGSSAVTYVDPVQVNNGIGPFYSESIFRAPGNGGLNPVLSLPGSGVTSPVSGSWVYCTSAGVGVASGLRSSALQPPNFTYRSSSTLTNRIEGCSEGVRVDIGQSYALSAWVFESCTTAVNVRNGGRVLFDGTSPAFSTVTNELLIDGTAYTFSFLTGLPAPQVIVSPLNSVITR